MLLAGCTVGPNYHRPDAPTAPAFKESAVTPPPGIPGGGWKQVGPNDSAIRPDWWEIYQDPELDKLEQDIKSGPRGESPLELLILSACETASGDDRAALGLAGVALKAGARSAVASLWYVSDKASEKLVADLYQALQSGRLSKAQALRAAQKQLLASPQFSHPAYWAPYLLIGNWL